MTVRERKRVSTYYDLERMGCAITIRVRNCCTNWLSSAQHMMWVSRSSRERSITPHNHISRYRPMGRPCGGDTSKLLVNSGSRTGKDVPNASCGGSVGVCSNVTTQLAQSEKLRYIGVILARARGGLVGAVCSPLGSSSY